MHIKKLYKAGRIVLFDDLDLNNTISLIYIDLIYTQYNKK